MNPADVLHYGRQTLYAALARVPVDAAETGGACGIWSVKQIMAHLTSYEHILEEVLTGFVGTGDGSTPVLASFLSGDTFNDQQLTLRAGASLAEVTREFDETHARVLTLVGQIAAERWREPGTLPWYGDAYSLDDLIVYMYYGHYREHSAQVNAFADRLAMA